MTSRPGSNNSPFNFWFRNGSRRRDVIVPIELISCGINFLLRKQLLWRHRFRFSATAFVFWCWLLLQYWLMSGKISLRNINIHEVHVFECVSFFYFVMHTLCQVSWTENTRPSAVLFIEQFWEFPCHSLCKWASLEERNLLRRIVWCHDE